MAVKDPAPNSTLTPLRAWTAASPTPYCLHAPTVRAPGVTDVPIPRYPSPIAVQMAAILSSWCFAFAACLWARFPAHDLAAAFSLGFSAFRTALAALSTSAAVALPPDGVSVFRALNPAHASLSLAVGVIDPGGPRVAVVLVPAAVVAVDLPALVVVVALVLAVLQPAASNATRTIPPIQEVRI